MYYRPWIIVFQLEFYSRTNTLNTYFLRNALRAPYEKGCVPKSQKVNFN